MSQTLAIAATPKEMLAYLTKSRGAIEMALPKHLNPDRMMRLALTCFSTSAAIRECSPQSILSSVVVASQLGLEIGVAGQGYLIPYKKTCTFVPGWQGLVSLLNNTGRATAWTGAVFEGDLWEFELGSSPKCRHVPGPNYGDPEHFIWAYACGQVNGSEKPVIEAWPVSLIKKRRDRFNKVGDKHYSFQHFEMYARKVVLLQVLKYMPRSIELNNAIVATNAAEMGTPVTVESGNVVEIESEVKSDPPPDAAKLFTKSPAENTAVKSEPAGVEQPKEKPAKPAPVEETKRQFVIRLLTEGGVSFDDARSYIGTKNISKDADSWGSWDEAPEAVFEILREEKTLVNIIKIYGTKKSN